MSTPKYSTNLVGRGTTDRRVAAILARHEQHQLKVLGSPVPADPSTSTLSPSTSGDNASARDDWIAAGGRLKIGPDGVPVLFKSSRRRSASPQKRSARLAVAAVASIVHPTLEGMGATAAAASRTAAVRAAVSLLSGLVGADVAEALAGRVAVSGAIGDAATSISSQGAPAASGSSIAAADGGGGGGGGVGAKFLSLDESKLPLFLFDDSIDDSVAVEEYLGATVSGGIEGGRPSGRFAQR